MDAMGINGSLLLIQLIPVIVLIILPIIALVDLAKKKNERRAASIVGAHYLRRSTFGGAGILDHQTYP